MLSGEPKTQETDEKKPTMPNPKPFANPLINKNLLPKNSKNKQFMSPTDNLFSPVTIKVEEKRNHLFKSAKPSSLASRFADAQKE